MKKVILFLIAIVASTFCFSQTSLSGIITDEDGEPVILGNIVLYQNGALVTGTETDFDGNYIIENIEPGTYDVEVDYVGYSRKRLTDIVVSKEEPNILDVTLTDKDLHSGCCCISIGYKIPLYQQDNTTSGSTIYNIRRGESLMSFTTGF